MQCAERPIGGAFSGGAICKNFMFFLQGAKGFYDLLLISALFFCFFIRRSKTADLVQNLVYIILEHRSCLASKSLVGLSNLHSLCSGIHKNPKKKVKRYIKIGPLLLCSLKQKLILFIKKAELF